MSVGPLSFGSESQADAWTCVQNARWSPERTSLLASKTAWTQEILALVLRVDALGQYREAWRGVSRLGFS